MTTEDKLHYQENISINLKRELDEVYKDVWEKFYELDSYDFEEWLYKQKDGTWSDGCKCEEDWGHNAELKCFKCGKLYPN